MLLKDAQQFLDRLWMLREASVSGLDESFGDRAMVSCAFHRNDTVGLAAEKREAIISDHRMHAHIVFRRQFGNGIEQLTFGLEQVDAGRYPATDFFAEDTGIAADQFVMCPDEVFRFLDER